MDASTSEAVLRHDFRLSATIMYILSCDWIGKKKKKKPAKFSCTGNRVTLEEGIHRRWKVLTDIRLMTAACSYTKQAARSPMWYTWNVSCIFIVSLCIHCICLRVDVFEINSCLNILLTTSELVSLCILHVNVCFAEHWPDAKWKNLFICRYWKKQTNKQPKSNWNLCSIWFC